MTSAEALEKFRLGESMEAIALEHGITLLECEQAIREAIALSLQVAPLKVVKRRVRLRDSGIGAIAINNSARIMLEAIA